MVQLIIYFVWLGNTSLFPIQRNKTAMEYFLWLTVHTEKHTNMQNAKKSKYKF
jgi:hypothetical protein